MFFTSSDRTVRHSTVSSINSNHHLKEKQDNANVACHPAAASQVQSYLATKAVSIASLLGTHKSMVTTPQADYWMTLYLTLSDEMTTYAGNESPKVYRRIINHPTQ